MIFPILVVARFL